MVFNWVVWSLVALFGLLPLFGFIENVFIRKKREIFMPVFCLILLAGVLIVLIDHVP